jgi:hypothetical protein
MHYIRFGHPPNYWTTFPKLTFFDMGLNVARKASGAVTEEISPESSIEKWKEFGKGPTT